MAGVKTEIPVTRNTPLAQLAEHDDRLLRRVVPPKDTVKAPVATFDASL